jgi:hypothetical protein
MLHCKTVSDPNAPSNAPLLLTPIVSNETHAPNQLVKPAVNHAGVFHLALVISMTDMLVRLPAMMVDSEGR